MGLLSVGDVITILCVIAGILANYFAMRSEIRIMRNEMTPIVRWWNRIAENQANRLFIRSRSDDQQG
jgi:hypothetical protein